MKRGIKFRHMVDIRQLQEFAGLAGSNDGALDPLYNKHCGKFHDGSDCEAAQNALKIKKSKQR